MLIFKLPWKSLWRHIPEQESGEQTLWWISRLVPTLASVPSMIDCLEIARLNVDWSSLWGKSSPCFLHCPSEKYDAHTGCSWFDTKKQGDAHAAQRGDGPKSQEINLPDMESNCQHEAEETTQTLNTSEKSSVISWAVSGEMVEPFHTPERFSAACWHSPPSPPLPTAQFVFIVNYKERSTWTCRNPAAPQLFLEQKAQDRRWSPLMSRGDTQNKSFMFLYNFFPFVFI